MDQSLANFVHKLASTIGGGSGSYVKVKELHIEDEKVWALYQLSPVDKALISRFFNSSGRPLEKKGVKRVLQTQLERILEGEATDPKIDASTLDIVDEAYTLHASPFKYEDHSYYCTETCLALTPYYHVRLVGGCLALATTLKVEFKHDGVEENSAAVRMCDEFRIEKTGSKDYFPETPSPCVYGTGSFMGITPPDQMQNLIYGLRDFVAENGFAYFMGKREKITRIKRN